MVNLYTDIELVSEELNGVSITGSTTPSINTINGWIEQVSSEIELRTGKVWESTQVTAEILDYDGSGFLRLPANPVIDITSLEYEENGLGAASTSWVALTEGRNNDFILHVNDGEIEFIGTNKPSKGTQNIRITYNKGYSTTPPYITRLATLMVAKRFIQSVVQASAKEEGGSVTVGNISITDPTNFGAGQVTSISTEIEDIFRNRIGSTHVFRPSRHYGLRY